MGDFKNLTVWKRSRALSSTVYRATARFPADELHGMTSQLRRGAVSIASNIAEGCGRHSGRDQAKCYRIALGSAREVESLLLVAGDVKLIGEAAARELVNEVDEIERMLTSLIRYCLTGKKRGNRVTPTPSAQPTPVPASPV